MNTERLLMAGMLVAGAGMAALIYDAVRDRVVQVGDSAPEFTFVADSGMTVNLEQLRGKVVMLNFWATWCGPCVKETPDLEAIHRDLGPSGLVVVGVSVDKNEKKYKAFLRRFGVTYLTRRDAEAALPDLYGSYRYPETYIIDKSGKVVQKVIGAEWKREDMERYLRTLL